MFQVIRPCPEFRRIRELPIYDKPPEHWQEVAVLLDDQYRKPGGEWLHREIQAQMNAEAYDAGGLFAMAPVGSGKTLPSFQIPALMNAQRPLLMIRASLRQKTINDMKVYDRHFRIHDGLKILSYDMLSQPHAQEILQALNPDLILADEAQCLKNLQAARTKRFLRFMAEARVPFIALSGTMTRKALRDYWHLMCLAHPDGGAPIPYKEGTMAMWGGALDSKVDSFRRVPPGALLSLADDFGVPNHLEPLERARKGYHARMIATLGVVTATASSCDKPLALVKRPLQTPDIIKEALRNLRNTWEAPNGDECDSKLEIWRYARELACGFYGVWDPPPPKDWLEARKKWHRFVRYILNQDNPKLDSPFLVANAYKDHPLHVAWADIKPTFEPNTVPIWVDDFLVNDAAVWLREHQGIVWIEHITVGERIARAAGVRYYGGGPIAARDIEYARGPIVCSIKAHSIGRNLQRYNRALVVSPPPSGDAFEQLIGRLHRPGQDQRVLVEMYGHCPELLDGIDTAMQDASYIKSTTGNEQKLLLGVWE